jgi:hypothetical protein
MLVTCPNPASSVTYLALCNLHQRVIRHDERDVRLGLRGALVHAPGLLEVDGPDTLLAGGGFEVELEDAVRLEGRWELGWGIVGRRKTCRKGRIESGRRAAPKFVRNTTLPPGPSTERGKRAWAWTWT